MNILQYSDKAKAYYNRLRANIVHGWEKYVATDGERCVFVRSDYEPGPGEAVFYLVTRNRNTLCQLHKQGTETAHRTHCTGTGDYQEEP